MAIKNDDIRDAVELAVANVQEHGLTDIFRPQPDELSFLADPDFRARVIDVASGSIRRRKFEELEIGPITHCLTPKSRTFDYDYRRAALIQPMDLIKYLSLVLLAAEPIERARIEKSRDIVISYRFTAKNPPAIYDPRYDHQYFREKLEKKARKATSKIVVKCDISNFYDRLNLHRLESLLEDIGVEKWLTNTLNQTLLFWARKDSFGLPIGSNGSRTLAEAALIEVDNYLVSLEADYIRFVDDLYIFARGASDAQFFLYQLIDRLSLEGLMLNGAKTRIYESEEFLKTNKKQEEAELRKAEDQQEGKAKKRTRKRRQPAQQEIVASGYGGVPRRFVLPPEEEEGDEAGDGVEIEALLDSLETKELINPMRFEEFVKKISTQGRYDLLGKLPNLLSKCPAFIEYCVDMLFKIRDQVSEEVKASVSSDFGRFLKERFHKLLEWDQVCLVRLLGSKDFSNKRALMHFFRTIPRTSGSYIGSMLIRHLGLLAGRGEAFELRKYYERADQWEKRAILKVLAEKLPKDELGAFQRYARSQTEDPFALIYLSSKRGAKDQQK